MNYRQTIGLLLLFRNVIINAKTKCNLMNFHENLVNFHDNYDNENSEIITKKLYVDIIQIFLYLLQLFGRSD